MSNRGMTIGYPVTGFSKCIVGYSTALVELVFALVVSDKKLCDVTHFGWWWLDDSPQKLWQLSWVGPPPWETLFGPERNQVWKVSLSVSTFHFWHGRCCDSGIHGRQRWAFVRTRISLSKFRDCTDLRITSSAKYISSTFGRPVSGRLFYCLLVWFFSPILCIMMILLFRRPSTEE